MKIYHYTSIETLALILKNKTIRFNRLNLCDDIEEAEYGTQLWGAQLGQYAFVSCWSKDSIENIALWKMYASGSNGVRIGVNMKDVFELKEVSERSYKFTCSEDVGIDYRIRALDKFEIFYDVDYVAKEFMAEKMSKGISRPNDKAAKGYGWQTYPVGKYKNMIWKFQNECRFKIFAEPIDPATGNHTEMFKGNKKIKKKFFDIKVQDAFFNNIEIMLSPFAGESPKIIVESLCQKYAPVSTIIKSKVKIRK